MRPSFSMNEMIYIFSLLCAALLFSLLIDVSVCVVETIEKISVQSCVSVEEKKKNKHILYAPFTTARNLFQLTLGCNSSNRLIDGKFWCIFYQRRPFSCALCWFLLVLYRHFFFLRMFSASGVSLNERKVDGKKLNREKQTATKISQHQWRAFGNYALVFAIKIRLQTKMKNVHLCLSAIVNNVEKVLHSNTVYVYYIYAFSFPGGLENVVCKTYIQIHNHSKQTTNENGLAQRSAGKCLC